MMERELIVFTAAQIYRGANDSDNADAKAARRSVQIARRLITTVDRQLKLYPTFEEFERMEAILEDHRYDAALRFEKEKQK